MSKMPERHYQIRRFYPSNQYEGVFYQKHDSGYSLSRVPLEGLALCRVSFIGSEDPRDVNYELCGVAINYVDGSSGFDCVNNDSTFVAVIRAGNPLPGDECVPHHIRKLGRLSEQDIANDEADEIEFAKWEADEIEFERVAPVD
jgi:hypothetical protein